LAPTGHIKKILIVANFFKNCRVDRLNTYKEYMKRNVPLAQYLSEFFLEKETLQKKFVDEFKKNIFFNKYFLKKCFYEIMWKNILESYTEYMMIKYSACALDVVR